MCNIKINRRKEIKNDKISIFVLGNPILKDDSLPIKLIPKLEKKFPQINFLEFDPTEELHSEEVILMDLIEGIKNVEIIRDLDKLETRRVYSTHDFDAAFLLKLLKKAKLIKEVTIIGIPKNAKEKEIIKELEVVIRKMISDYEKKFKKLHKAK